MNQPWVVLARGPWSLTLRDCELLLQRHQLQSEELRHLLVLLLLPAVNTKPASRINLRTTAN